MSATITQQPRLNDKKEVVFAIDGLPARAIYEPDYRKIDILLPLNQLRYDFSSKAEQPCVALTRDSEFTHHLTLRANFGYLNPCIALLRAWSMGIGQDAKLLVACMEAMAGMHGLSHVRFSEHAIFPAESQAVYMFPNGRKEFPMPAMPNRVAERFLSVVGNINPFNKQPDVMRYYKSKDHPSAHERMEYIEKIDRCLHYLGDPELMAWVQKSLQAIFRQRKKRGLT